MQKTNNKREREKIMMIMRKYEDIQKMNGDYVCDDEIP